MSNYSVWNGTIPVHAYHSIKVIYVEIPKSGCTSIKTALAPLRGDRFDLNAEDIHVWTGYMYARGVDRLYDWLDDRWPDFYKFTVVRNPVERFKSFYFGLNPKERGEYNTPDNINAFVKSHLEFNSWMCDIHAIPQNWLTGRSLNHFSHVGRIEALNATEDALREWTGHTIHIPHLNRSQHRESLNKESRQKLEEMYEDDFELFHYRRKR